MASALFYMGLIFYFFTSWDSCFFARQNLFLGEYGLAFFEVSKNNCEKNDAGAEKKIDIDAGEE